MNEPVGIAAALGAAVRVALLFVLGIIPLAGGNPIHQKRGATNRNRICGVVHPGRVGTRPRSFPSEIGVCFINPAFTLRDPCTRDPDTG